MKNPRLFALIILCYASTSNAQITDCIIPPSIDAFRTQLSWQSGTNRTSAIAVPIVANLNPKEDAMPEIIVCGTNARIEIYRGDGSNKNAPMTLTVPGGFATYPPPGPVIGDVNNDGSPELLMACQDRRIRVFHKYAETTPNPMALWITTAANQLYATPTTRISLADFDADGTPEVYAGSDIYKFDFTNPLTPALNRVLTGQAFGGKSTYSNYTTGSCSPVAVDILSVADCKGDPDCAGLELVAGPMIYSVDLDTKDGDGIQMKAQRDLNTMQSTDKFGDGYTAIADTDLDGVLDVVVSGKKTNGNVHGLYVWNKNKFLMFGPYPTNSQSSGGIPCIANVYKDDGGGPDFPEIMLCSSRNFTCFNLNAAKKAPTQPYWWNLPTTDASGWTGATVFDFNGDGQFEIVYRDERFLRILYGGSAPFPAGVDVERNWSRIGCRSGTSDEYPVVADVDNDGETEIAVTGTATSTNFNALWVYEAASSIWQPSRKLWNQYNYFTVNVNDDLSIPAVQMPDHHLELPNPGSGKRPLNTFLAQRSPEKNLEGIPLPDATAQFEKSNCENDSFAIQVSFCNRGITALKPGTPIALYTSDPTTTNASLFGPIRYLALELKPDSCTSMTITLPKTFSAYYGMINDDGSKPRPYTLDFANPLTSILECNWLNNSFVFKFDNTPPKLDLGADIISCRDSLITLQAGTDYASWRWQDGSTLNTFSTTNAGTYWVETRVNCAPTQYDTIVIAHYPSPTATPTVRDVSCFGKNDGSLDIALSGGAPGFAFQWSNLKTGPKIENLSPGNYSLTLTYANGKCVQISDYQIIEPNEILLSAASSPAICKGAAGGSIDLNIQNGVAPLAFKWSNNSNAEDPNNLRAGNYVVTVTDATGCTRTLEKSVPERPAIALASSIKDALCAGSKDGTASVTPSGGTPPFQYLWSNSEKTAQITGIPAGTYTATVSDAGGCSEVISVNVKAPQPLLSKGIAAQPSCPDVANGALSFLGAAQGTPPYTLRWADGSTSANLSNLPPGNYPLTITDAQGCEISDAAQVLALAPPTTTPTVRDVSCFGKNDGSLDIALSGGSPGFAFQWSNLKTGPKIETLAPGAYKLTVTYADGKCAQTFDYQIIEPKEILLSAASSPAICKGAAGGSIDLNIQNGIAPLAFKWSNNSNAEDPNDLRAGNYVVTVTDATGCSRTLEKSVPERPAISLASSTQDARCAGSKDGTASITPSGGTPPFQYLWSNSEKTAQITGVPAGAYTATVSDAGGCSEVISVNVKAPQPLLSKGIAVQPSCPDVANGALSFLGAAQGTPPYTLRWADGSTSANLANLPPGNYPLTITDAQGCEISDAAQVLALATPTATPTVRDVSCFGKNDGSLNIALSGGAPGFAFQWSNLKTGPKIENLAPGAYKLTVTYADGKCAQTFDYQIIEPTKIELTGQKIEAPKCFGASNGSIDVSCAGGFSPYRFAWSNGQKTQNIAAVKAGNYVLTVTDANDCIFTSQFAVTQPEALFSDANIHADTCEMANGRITASATGGTKPYQITWSNGQQGTSIMALKTGGYELTLSDANGCTFVLPLQVPAHGKLPKLSADGGKITCFSPEITVQALSDQSNLNYKWEGSSGTLGDKKSHIVNTGGAYRVTATNAFGCTAQAQTLVLEDKTPPTAEAGPKNVRVSCKDTQFLLDASASSKGSAFENRWTGQGRDTLALKISVSKPGIYVHSVRDLLNGCLAKDSIRVDWDELIQAKIELKPILCRGANDGTIAITHLSGGSSPVTYSIDNQIFTSKNYYTNLPAGTYNVAVRDPLGCLWSDKVVLTDPPLLQVKLTAHDTSIEIGQYVRLNAAITPKNADLSLIEWEPLELDFVPNALKQQVDPTESTSILVRITDKNGCVAEDVVAVKVSNFSIYVPNVIRHNSDLNGSLTVFAASDVMEVLFLQVYDRWGSQVFERRDFSPNNTALGWDGTLRGQPCEAGVYVWQAAVRVSDGRVFYLKGDVTVLR